MEHAGSLLSGVVTCSCGWASSHYAMASEAVDEFNAHVDEEETAEHEWLRQRLHPPGCRQCDIVRRLIEQAETRMAEED